MSTPSASPAASPAVIPTRAVPDLGPSEVVLLRAEDFVPGFKPPPYIVRHDQWMRLVWLAATAAVVQAGDVRLTVETRKWLFGLLSGQAVRAERGTGREHGPGAWPAGSLEAALVDRVARGPEDLRAVYVALIGGRSRTPVAEALQVARAGLIRRGLLEVHEIREKLLGLIPTRTSAYAPSPLGERVAAAADVAGVRHLADAGGGMDPAMWALVGRTFTQAIDACTVPDRTSDVDAST